jgi:hypothetical protein
MEALCAEHGHPYHLRRLRCQEHEAGPGWLVLALEAIIERPAGTGD